MKFPIVSRVVLGFSSLCLCRVYIKHYSLRSYDHWPKWFTCKPTPRIPAYSLISCLVLGQLIVWQRWIYLQKISISAQPLKMALHKNPGMHGSRMVIFLHDSQKALFLARLKALFLHDSKGNSLNLHDITYYIVLPFILWFNGPFVFFSINIAPMP